MNMLFQKWPIDGCLFSMIDGWQIDGLHQFLHAAVHGYASPGSQIPEGRLQFLQCQHGHVQPRPHAGCPNRREKRKCPYNP